MEELIWFSNLGLKKSLRFFLSFTYLFNYNSVDLEWLLKSVGAVQSEMTEPPRKEVHDVMMSSIRQAATREDDNDDW